MMKILVLICSLCAALAALSCSGPGDGKIRRLLDGLPPDLVRHLDSSDDSTLLRFGRDTGFETLHGMNNQIGMRILDLWVKGKKDDALLVENYRLRLARVFEIVYNSDFYLRDIEYLRSLPDGTRDSAMRARHEYGAVQLDRSLSPEDAIEIHARYARTFASLGDNGWEAMAKLNISDAYERAGDVPHQRRYLIEACSDFERVGRHKMTCEALGRLGSRYEAWGFPDSMVACYERAFAIASQHRMGYQAARIVEFYSGYYGRMGRLDLQRRLLDQAMDLARAYDPGCYEVRFLKEAMRFNADLGCWDVVENLVTQVRGIEPRCEHLNLVYGEVHLLRTDVFDAQVKMAQGDTARAEEIFRSVNRRLPALRLPDSYRSEDDEYSCYRAEGLLSNGRPRDALEEALRKLSQPPEQSLPQWSARISLVAAKAALRLGELDTAEEAAGKFDRFAAGKGSALRAELSERNALAGMIALARSDTARAIDLASDALRKLRAEAMSIDASVGSYLWLTRSDILRQLLHDLAAKDALAGYGAEIYWRELYELLGSDERNGSAAAGGRSRQPALSPAPLAAGKEMFRVFRSLGRGALEDVRRLHAIHCVYLVRDEEVWRWTASPGGVRREVLPISTHDLRSLVANARALMSSYAEDPDSPVTKPLQSDLERLARGLLPPEALASPDASEEPHLFLVTTDSFLATIPFEAFDTGSGEKYEPLLSRRDVAYVRHTRRGGVRPAGGKSVILVNPHLAREYHGGVRPLPVLGEAEEEGKSVGALDPSAVVIAGESATKQNLIRLWGDAPYLYVAAHTVAGVPYIAALVLAEPAGDRAPDAAVLDVTDIRAADLTRCRVVVLSGCSSGSPYVAAKGAAPSLGDAFLDAGAGAVVHTFWDVQDEDARRIGTSFIEKRTAAKTGDIRALSDARRSQIAGPAGVRHPSRWAAYAITVSRL